MKRYALLVGIDCYLSSDGSRRFLEDQKPVSLTHLKGCVYDIKAIENMLRNQYGMPREDITVLSSSLPHVISHKGIENLVPVESSEPRSLPTFNNIKEAFETMSGKVVAGDSFFFHFSGHGARLPRVRGSPLCREKDPSLMTFDFCRGERAVRGWVLNQWLRALNEKGVLVVVSLDSCYSGEAWRAGNNEDHIVHRTPADWAGRSFGNLQTDEEDCAEEPTYRAGELDTSWSLNPENFTLMTACSVEQRAAERSSKKKGGRFTQALLKYLRKSNYHVTYRMAMEHLRQVLAPQTPQIHGRDRFLFLGNSEPFSITPLKARVQGDELHIPAGRAHGIKPHSEFVPFSSTPAVTQTFTIDSVREFTSTARLSPEARVILRRHNDTIVVSKWCLGDDCALRVVLDRDFEPTDDDFKRTLLEELQNHISSNVEVISSQESVNDAQWPQHMVFHLQREHGSPNKIKICGPEALVGYSGPVLPLIIPTSNNRRVLASGLASPLLHLCRFGHSLNLNLTSPRTLSYKVSLLPDSSDTPGAPSSSQDQRYIYNFHNADQQDLFFTILGLSPEFSIKQLFPSNDTQQRVGPGNQYELGPTTFHLPDAPAEINNLFHRTSRREIIRTVVTTKEGVSWKMLEIPNIWEANLVKTAQSPEYREGFMETRSIDKWSVFDSILMLDY